MKYLLPEIHVALRIFSMVAAWSSNVQILYKKFALARDFKRILKVPGKVPIGRAFSKKQWILSGGV